MHGRFEPGYVELIGLTSADLAPRVKPAKLLEDPFAAMMRHIASSFAELEHSYALDKAGAVTDAKNDEARSLIVKLTASAAELMRDLLDQERRIHAARESAGWHVHEPERLAQRR